MDPDELRQLAVLLRESGDPRARIWRLGDARSPFMPSMIEFGAAAGENGFGVSVVDPFDGRVPLFLSPRTLGETDVMFVPSVLLDSQMVTYLGQYRTQEGFRKTEQGRVVRQMLVWLILKGFDYNPLFYLVENLVKQGQESFAPHLRRMADTLVAFHSMDEARFLREDVIVPNPATVDNYLIRFGAKDISEVSAEMGRLLLCPAVNGIVANTRKAVTASYSVLLKAALIHKTTCASFTKKLRLLRDFIEQELGVTLAREFLLMTDYFAGRCDRFIPFQKGARWKKFSEKLLASAWDMHLLRVPELMLSWSNEREAAMGFPCTADGPLRVIGAMYTIEAVINMPPDTDTPAPIILFNAERVRARFGDEIANQVLELSNSGWAAAGSHVARDRPDLLTVVGRLEDEARNWCVT